MRLTANTELTTKSTAQPKHSAKAKVLQSDIGFAILQSVHVE